MCWIRQIGEIAIMSLICLIPFTVILAVFLYVFRPGKYPTRFVPIYVVVSGLFFAILSAFLILDSGISNPVNEAYWSSGFGSVQSTILVSFPIYSLGVLALGGIAASAIIKGLHLNSTSAQLAAALLTGFILGTPIGVVYHLEAPGFGGEASYIFLALEAITITTVIVFLVLVIQRKNKKSGSRYPATQYGISAGIGGVMGIISVIMTLILMDFPFDEVPDHLDSFITSLMHVAGIGALAGIIAGRIGYLIRPRKEMSIGGAVLGSAVVSILTITLLTGFGDLRESITVNRLQEMYPEHKPIPSLPATYQTLTTLYNWGGDRSCVVTSDGSRLAFRSGNQIILWDLNENRQIDEFPSHGNLPLALSPDGHLLALDDLSHNIILRDLRTGEQFAQLDDVYELVFSPNGQRIAARYISPLHDSNRIDLLDPATAKEVARIEVEVPGGFRTLTFSPDGTLLAAITDDQITLWDTASLKRVGKLNVDGSVDSMAFSPDGSRLAAGIYSWQMDDRMIGLWEINTRKFLLGIRAPDMTWNIGFSPDGQKLITTGSSSLYLWDANSLEPLGSVTGGRQWRRTEALFLPDGRVLECYDPSGIGIWTIESP